MTAWIPGEVSPENLSLNRNQFTTPGPQASGTGSGSRFIFLCLAVGVAALANSLGTEAFASDGSDSGQGLLRYDPVLDTLVPVPEAEAKPGYVYSHFSLRLNRRVWAIRQADGRFSHALGESTTQPALAMDLRQDRQAGIEKLAQTDKELLRRLDREGGSVFFRLNNQGQWRLAPMASQPSIYDAETLWRWEWLSDHYIPVSSGPFAYRWLVVRGQYVPVKEWACGAAP